MQDAKTNAYVTLEGDLDFTKRARVAELLPDPATLRSALINCSRLTYADSTVVGMLVQFRRRFLESGGKPDELVMILPPEGSARAMLDITGMAKLFTVVELHPE
jgi:anti-anti-sigma factor